ncbi:amino acid adenylation domain-containing protein [Kitasatospora sp. NPDC097643]|uniref:amino acid adenylation domain-containing protein n=1 Tax=Kitasatospora sp. NPDC097643 TaxID=3157230 RepID=UPI003332D1D1
MTMHARRGGPAAEQDRTEQHLRSAHLAELVARQARLTPHAPAVLTAERAWSYQEIDDRADRLAARLRGQGAGPDTLVAVQLPRSVDLVVALLAVWRAGSAYLPMDPAHPEERRAWMLADTRARFLVTRSEPEPAVAEAVARTGATVIALDRTAEEAGGPVGDRQPNGPVPPVEDDHTAYAIYTSGSTGTPKAVLVTHAGIRNRVLWAVATHRLTADDRVLHKTPIGFDAAGWEIFAPLVSGGAVALAPVGAERDPAALLAAAAAHRATVLQVVPSVLRELVREPGWARLPDLRLLYCGGEPLDAGLCRRALERSGNPGLRIWNGYGPTECSVDVAAHPYDPAQTAGPVPIGRPVDGARLLVLDAEGALLPQGATGELWVGGTGVARGYLNRPGLTAERFVPDPYGPPGARLYRTGDLVRWRADGTLEYRGRTDHQVKVNGIRIEPGEIEAALVVHPLVRGAVVQALDLADGGRRLIGHVLTDDGRLPAGLREFLARRLPEGMVPGSLTALASFPLTPNGKVDRAALPLPGADQDDRPAFVAPRTPAEAAVAAAWQELLGRGPVSVHDDFFRLGGSSLLLTRLAGLLLSSSGRQVGLRELYLATTVEEQARLLAGARDDRPVRPVERGGPLPLSYGQRRLYFLDQLNPGGPEWVSPLLVELPHGIGPGTVQHVLDTLEARHESLRTRYGQSPDGPWQQVAEPGPVELAVVQVVQANATDAADATDRGELTRALGDRLAQGFDLARGPIWRALLIERPDEAPLLLLTIHHIAGDGWSAALLEQEIAELCAAAVTNRAARLPELGVGYADFASWQTELPADRELAGELDFWRRELGDQVELPMPTDRPRPAERDHRGAMVPFTIPAELAGRLVDLGRGRGATPFMTLLTGFAVLLARYSGEWDVSVGTPVAGRVRPEVEGVVGFFLNSLVVRSRLAAELSFEQAVDEVRRRSLAALAHQHLPFELLVEELQPERDLSRTPLYQVAFDLHDETLTSLGVRPEVAEAVQDAWQIAKTDLSLFMRRQPDGSFHGLLEYATGLYRRDTVERMAGQLLRLLESAAARPDTPLAQLELLPADEHERQLVTWNATRSEAAPDTVVDLFEARAADLPDAPAVLAGGAATSFADLDARANRIAHALRRRGVGADSVVGVLLDRGPDLIAAFLGVWKAGGAYVPLDPSHPDERLAGVLRDVRAAALIGTTAGTAVFDGPTVLLDRDARELAQQPGSRPERRTDPRGTAYVIFTSGSTGRPKGVEIEHRNLAHHVTWAARELAGRGTTGAPLFSSCAFDLVVPNLYAPLLAGQPVHLLPADLDLTRLGAELVAGAPYSFVKLTPSHLEILDRQLDDEQAASLAQVVVVAGEAFPADAANRWLARLGPGRLFNEYGPTECSVGTSLHPVDTGVQASVVPIGRPLPGLAMYVLDEALRPLPLGAIGELYVGGAGVGRGYTGQPAQTAQRFLPDPYGPPGARLYRTGDLVRQLPDGTVAFVGRRDGQIKIRGHRVEIGEIESVLGDHPAVHEAAVVADDSTGHTRLAAYLVPAAEQLPGDTELAAHCSRLLPAHMVPATFTALAALPLNANGKLDRAALRAPDAEPAERPSGVLEEGVAEVWAALVGAEPGRDEDFFRSGGNSLLALRLIADLQTEFEVDLPLRAIFDGPTVRQLAEAIELLIKAQIDALSDEELLADPTLSKEYDA